MKRLNVYLAAILLSWLALAPSQAWAQTANAGLRAGSKVFLKAAPDGFDAFLRAAMAKKKVPLTVVGSRDQAEFEITATSETQKASTSKKLIRLDFHSDEQASISISDMQSGEVVFAYSVNKKSSAHGKRSTAEACAKHLKDELGRKH